jgi:hypothetical protein
MALRNGHGSGKGQPRVEVLPPDELPAGMPEAYRSKQQPPAGEHGRFAPGNHLAAAGGRAKAGSTRLARRLGIADLPGNAPFAPYKRAAAAFRRFHVARLAASVGGGQCGPAPASIVATAAWQLAASRYLFDLVASGELGPDALKLASQLGNDSRQNLLASHEICAREAKAQPKPAHSWLTPVGTLPASDSSSEDSDASTGQPEPSNEVER